MRSDPRSLLLIPRRGKVNKKRKYRSLRNAVRNAMEYVMENGSNMVIYDTNRGTDIATIRKSSSFVAVDIHSPRAFSRLWNQ